MRSVRGFSLLELMIAVAIVGIIAAIAIPSYAGYVIRSNRTVAKSVVMRIAGLQESRFSDRKSYATVIGQLSSPATTATTWYVTSDGRTQTATSTDAIYSLTLAAYSPDTVANCSASGSPTATQYTIVATPINRQTKDTAKCGKLCYGSLGDKGASGSLRAECWRS